MSLERQPREAARLGRQEDDPAPARLRVRRVGLGSTARVGCLLGCIPALPVASLCTVAWLWTSGVVVGWMRRWETVTVNVLGVEIARIDLLQLTRLTGFYNRLLWVEDHDRLLAIGSFLAISLVGGVLVALVLVALAVVYNMLARLFGGISIEVD